MNRSAIALGKLVSKVTDSALGPYQSAVIRIGFAATWLLFLLREFPHRHELYGPDSPWSWELGERLVSDNGAFTVLLWTDSELWFEVVYVFAVLASLLLAVGWRTRAVSVFFMVGVLSLQNRSVFMGDGGDNVIHLMAVYLVFTRCGQVWSLDARRARRREAAGGEQERADVVGPVLWALSAGGLLAVSLSGTTTPDPFVPVLLWTVWAALGAWWLVGRVAPRSDARALFDVVGNIVHNTALLVIMAEACLIYATAGWYKIQGSRWQDGTALHYPLHLDYFSPWPGLADLLASNATMVMLITYGTVAVQVAFPFTLFNRRVKNVLLALMITEHLAIAVVLGLPFFSMAMIVADSVFLPTTFLRRVGDAAGRLTGRFRPDGQSGLASATAPAGTGPGATGSAWVPAQGGPGWAAERAKHGGEPGAAAPGAVAGTAAEAEAEAEAETGAAGTDAGGAGSHGSETSGTGASGGGSTRP
ncbi:HTTM domain-containing protein [Streptomyces fragilis]|uniref:HTTM domain-containing protein n=1 Tax=Streptomyces fragilis TaxID=67301 RepID=A0ABV2YFG6_9ACTN|nr:HTTM domain-containing protein [Streptomyces fragilis]